MPPKKKTAAQLNREIKQALASPSASASWSERLFVGTYPTGIVYADRQRERSGDYLRLAFLPFRTLALEWSTASIPPELRALILADAQRLQARRGESYPIDMAGHAVRLGE